MAWDVEKQSALREHIRDRALSVREEGFVLASGRRSTFLFNMKHLYGHPEAAGLLTEALLDRLSGLECDYVAGLELGAVFPVATAVERSSLTGRGVHGFIIRKEAKGHGSLNRVEGLHERDPRTGTVVVLEDVTTTGSSLLKAVEVVRDIGFTVRQAVTLVDRQEGAREHLAQHGVELLTLFGRSDFPEIPGGAPAQGSP